MRKLALAAALATSALATPALARDNSWYVGIDSGVTIVEDADLTFQSATTSRTISADHHKGLDADAVIGYDFGGFRLEAEAGYKRAEVDLDASGFGGATSALSFMLNGLLDFGPDDGLQGFVGGGVGVSRGKLANDLVNDSDTGFAWQAIAGVRYPLTDNVDVSLKYRFFNQDDIKLVSAYGTTLAGPAGSSVDTKIRSHSLLLGLAYNFGEPAAPPPVAECSPGPYIVFFDFDKSDITPDAGTILDNAVSAYSNCGSAQVMLAGYADRSGSASYNVGLSQRRADAVKAYIASKGIPDGVITTQAFGESNPRVETADGVRELQNRRVEITYGPGSGQ
jgi:OOP family OmpA-OmpF porin